MLTPFLLNCSNLECVSFWNYLKSLPTNVTLYYRALSIKSHIITCELPVENFMKPSSAMEDLNKVFEKKIKDTSGELIVADITTESGKKQSIFGYCGDGLMYGNVNTSQEKWTIPGHGVVNTVGKYVKVVGGKPFEQNISSISTTNLTNTKNYSVRPANWIEETGYPGGETINKPYIIDIINYNTCFSHELIHIKNDMTRVDKFTFKKSYMDVMRGRFSQPTNQSIEEKGRMAKEIERCALLEGHNKTFLEKTIETIGADKRIVAVKYNPWNKALQISYIDAQYEDMLAATPTVDLLKIHDCF